MLHVSRGCGLLDVHYVTSLDFCQLCSVAYLQNGAHALAAGFCAALSNDQQHQHGCPALPGVEGLDRRLGKLQAVGEDLLRLQLQ